MGAKYSFSRWATRPNKDGGYLTSRWELYKAERILSDLFNQSGISVQFFHGRGGSIRRGGEPMVNAIRSDPKEAYSGKIKITEQGEVIPSNYANVGLAVRHVEQIVFGMALSMLDHLKQPEERVDRKYLNLMEAISEANRAKYREFVLGNARFRDYFENATPIREFAMLKLGSRPVSRTGTTEIEDIRAIPWVFCWTQPAPASRLVSCGSLAQPRAGEARPEERDESPEGVVPQMALLQDSDRQRTDGSGKDGPDDCRAILET